jgi:formylglycine-generating enzyme required for sulfatase activity
MARMTSRAALTAAAVFVTAGAAYAVPSVHNVVMTQRANSRIVDITYELTGEAAIMTVGIETNGIALPDGAVTRLTGDVCKVVGTGAGKAIVWNAGADWPENLPQAASAKLTAWATNSPPLYMVVDVSGGAATNYYPVTYHVSEQALPEGGLTNDLYRTTRLVMRRVRTQVSGSTTENGVFMMGSPANENGRPTDESETYHQVTLTNDFYVGVFGITQGQWQQVMSDVRSWPSYWNNAAARMTRPVEQVSYYDIRENIANTDDAAVDWPNNSLVTAGSFMGRLRARTGLATFDLPTDAQREYACRAGTTTALNSGAVLTNTITDASLNLLGRYAYNGGKINGTVTPDQGCDATQATAKVGSYLPNAWGLYDMHGNVSEWCLDWYVADLTAASVVDPKGPSSASKRVRRGGSWGNPAWVCRSANRSQSLPSDQYSNIGFRLVRTLNTKRIEGTMIRFF